MVVIVCLFLLFFKIFNYDGKEFLCDFIIKFNGKFCIFFGFIKNVFYVGCLFFVYKLKIMKREENFINLVCVVEMKVKEDFDVFYIDEE